MFTVDEMIESIDASIAAEEVDRLELEHVVYVNDIITGLPSVFGPFADPISAARFAIRFVRDVGCDYEWALQVRVVPLDRISAPGTLKRRAITEQFRTARHLSGVRRVMRRSKRGM